MQSGYILKELRLTGDNVKPAKIEFTAGLNVISGPTNTGKSFIHQCINYMLGSSKKPKNIKESRPYQNIYLEILNYLGEPYTLESDFNGGNFKLYNAKIDEINKGITPKYLDRKHNPLNENNVSSFLLSQNNILNKRIRINKSGKTRNISYRDVVRYLLVNEERIITQESPIVSHYTKQTEELNTLKFIISGKDDSDVQELLSTKEITHRKGKIELLTELIFNSEDQELQKFTIEELNKSLNKTAQETKEIQSLYSKLKKEYLLLESNRAEAIEKSKELKSSRKVLMELLKRSKLLEQQYNNDIQRLKSTIEAGLLLSEETVLSKCPLCDNNLHEVCDESEILEILSACDAEIGKIENLKKELIQSVNLIEEESNDLSLLIEEAEIRVRKLTYDLEKGIGFEIDQIIDRMTALSNLKSYYAGLKDRKERLIGYMNQKEFFESSIPKNKDKQEYTKLSKYIAKPLCDEIENVLEQVKYPSIGEIDFSEEISDFIISGEERGLSGKGFRAITFTSFIVGLQKLLKDKHYSIGVPVLDSPFVTYRKPKANNEGISLDLAMDYYRYLANSNIEQFIIIENEEPPVDIQGNINHIIFSGVKGVKRFGFIPTD